MLVPLVQASRYLGQSHGLIEAALVPMGHGKPKGCVRRSRVLGQDLFKERHGQSGVVLLDPHDPDEQHRLKVVGIRGQDGAGMTLGLVQPSLRVGAKSGLKEFVVTGQRLEAYPAIETLDSSTVMVRKGRPSTAVATTQPSVTMPSRASSAPSKALYGSVMSSVAAMAALSSLTKAAASFARPRARKSILYRPIMGRSALPR